MVKHIYRYLLGMKKLALIFGEGKQGLEGFTDTDGASQKHRHLIFFFFFFFERHNSNGQPPKLVPRCTAQSVEVTATKRLHQGSIGAYWL